MFEIIKYFLIKSTSDFQIFLEEIIAKLYISRNIFVF